MGRLEEKEDPWKVAELKVDQVPWKDLSTGGKVGRVASILLRIVLLLALLYLFICSLDFLSSAFRLLGGKAAGRVFRESDILSNPVAGLMIGVLVTVLVQSSSTSTSIVITMVAASVIEADQAVFIIMGANIGTTVTNTIVSLAHAGDKNEFRRAFGGAVVHDMFNWLCVLIFLPLEAITGFLFKLTGKIVEAFDLKSDPEANKELLKKITSPFSKLVIQVDKNVIRDIALNKEGAEDKRILKIMCTFKDEAKIAQDVLNDDGTLNRTEMVYRYGRCETLFSYFEDLSDTAAGVIILVVALIILCVCLICIVKLLHSLLRGQIAIVIKKFINSDFPGCLKYFTGYVAILLGAGITILVQSSSIFTSALTPLVGVGVIQIERMFPLTLGSNIGTTFTGILAALTADSDKLGDSLQIAFCHLFFNIFGIIVWYPIPFIRQIPIRMAKTLGDTTADYRWFALLYLFLVFFILPAAVFGLSVAGWYVLLIVGGPLLVIFIAIVIINVLQTNKPEWLCSDKCRSWDWLPVWMHSLDPCDRLFRKCCPCGCCQRRFFNVYDNEDLQDIAITSNGNVKAGADNPSFVNAGV